MDEAMRQALKDYGKMIKENGWKAGEPLIDSGVKRWPDFRKWCRALGMMLRTKELLDKQS